MKCEMPGLRVALVARAGADPEPDRNGADLREALGDDALARIELRQDVLLSHGLIVTGFDQSQAVFDAGSRAPPGAADLEAVVRLEMTRRGGSGGGCRRTRSTTFWRSTSARPRLHRRARRRSGRRLRACSPSPYWTSVGGVQIGELRARRPEVVGQLLEDRRRRPSPARRSRSGRSGSSPARPRSAPGSSSRYLVQIASPCAMNCRLGQRRFAAATAAAGGGDGRRGQQGKRRLHARKASAARRPATARPPITPASTAESSGLNDERDRGQNGEPERARVGRAQRRLPPGLLPRLRTRLLHKTAAGIGEDEHRSAHGAEQAAEPGGVPGRSGGDRCPEPAECEPEADRRQKQYCG